jgi:hypothetical protein
MALVGGAVLSSSAIALRIRIMLIARNVLSRLSKETNISYAESLIKRIVLRDGYVLTFATSQMLGSWVFLGAGTAIAAGYLKPFSLERVYLTFSIFKLIMENVNL